jgi:MFS family permease
MKSASWGMPRSPVPSLLISLFIAYVALGVIGPVTPLLLLAEGASAAQIGLVASAHSVGFILGTLTFGRLIGAIGHRRSFAVAVVVAASVTGGMAMARAPALWALLRVALGVAHAGICLVAESWLNAHATNQTRGRVFSAYMLTTWGGNVLGPLTISIVPASAGLLALAAFVMLLGLARVSPVGLVCCLAAGLSNSAFYAMSPVALSGRGYSQAAIAGFLVAINLAGMVAQMPIGLLSDWIGRRQAALGVLLVGSVVGVAIYNAATAPYWVVVALGAAYSAMTSGLYGLGSSQTSDRLAGGDMVAASGGLLLVWACGAAIGPAVAGRLMAAADPWALFLYLPAVMASVAIFTAVRMVLRSDAPRAERAVAVTAKGPG